MRDSPFYQEIVAEGRVEGRVVGRLEGRLEGSRAAILQVLTLRFDAKPAAKFTKQLNAIQDVERLGELLTAAILCADIREFRATMRAAEQ